jgi:hypothetical protein
MPLANAPTTRRDLIRAVWLLGSGMALGAVAAPILTGEGPPARALQQGAEPTKTREAELAELHSLRTEVAAPDVCTPASTSTPPPATAVATVVPPLAAGQPVPHGDNWSITVLGIAPIPAGGPVPTQGRLLRVNVIVENRTSDPRRPPFTRWLLTDVRGQSYAVSQQASSEIAGVAWGLPVGPGVAEDRAMVFDVPSDAGTTFTLESREEPTFRVALVIEARG